MTETVPIDEGEAEAQPDTPVVTIRLLDREVETYDGSQFPRKVRFEIPARGKRGVLDQIIHDRAVRYLQEQGYGVDGNVETGYLDAEGERVWAATYTITGYVD